MRPLSSLVLVLGACGASAKSSVPTAQPPGPVVTQEMMIGIAAKRQPLASFVDAKRGVVFIDDSGRPGEEPPPPEAPSLECGAQLTALVDRFQAELSADTGIKAAREEGRLSCSNTPSPPRCTLGAPMEWSPAIHFVFAVDPTRGIVLRGIALNDEAAVAGDAVAQHRAEQIVQIDKLAASGCP